MWHMYDYPSANAMPIFCSFAQTSRSFPCFIALETRSYAASNLPSWRACKYRRTVSSGESGDGPATAARTTTRSASAPSAQGDQRARGMQAPYHRPPAGRKPASILHRRAPFFRRTPHSLARRIPAILCLRRWHVTCCPACGMDENAGNLIRTLRQKLSMAQEEVGDEIAVTVSTVNRWENAHAEPSKLAWKAIHRLAHKRGVADDILRRSTALADG